MDPFTQLQIIFANKEISSTLSTQSLAITITRNGESGKGIGEWGTGNALAFSTRNTKSRNL